MRDQTATNFPHDSGASTAPGGEGGPPPSAGAWSQELAALFRSERVALVRLAYLLTGRPGVAEDVVQDAFVRAQRSWNGVREPAAYLRTAVVNGCRSWGRHQAVVARNPLDPPEPVVQEPDELWDALGRLDERRRTAIVLRYYLDMPHADIAEVLDCAPTTARTTIHRALVQLRREITR